MTTRNFVPRNNNEGQLGTENKKWNKIYTNEIFATNFTGNLTGTADNAIKDNKNQQIDSTYIKDISINNDTLTVTKGNDGSQDITINNISHAISSDNAINANKLQELTAGNSKGQIPINNGIENVNLNAALLNGKASSYFATSNHTHTTATQSSNGYMSNADKKKLDGIASGAEVNQNAFANVKVGTTTIQADSKQDTLELAAGTNISLVGDANNDKVTIGVTGKVASATTADNATKATNATNADVSKKVNNTATNGSAIDLVTGTMASNDYFRIRIGGSNDAGYAEIATADNGSEPIYIRQYGGSNYGFSDPIRTATILDSSGNTSFPGTVTAPNFNGKATKATQDSDGNTITTTYLKRNPSPQNDMNACTVQGIYRFDGELKNAWTSTSWGTLLVFNNNYNGGSGTTGTYLVQMAFPTDCRIYMRQRVNTGAWSSWYKVAVTTDSTETDSTETLKKVYPVGSIYMSTVSTNPATLFGFGTWEAMPAGRVLLAQGQSDWGTNYAAGSTGGEHQHQLTVGEIPSHNHSGSTGSAGSHNHSASSSNVNISGTFGTGSATSNIFYKGDTSGCFYNTGNSGNNGTYRPQYTQDDRTQKVGINNTHSHIITVNSNGTHTHSVSIGNTGSGQAHSNMPPYLAIYIWKRVS